MESRPKIDGHGLFVTGNITMGNRAATDRVIHKQIGNAKSKSSNLEIMTNGKNAIWINDGDKYTFVEGTISDVPPGYYEATISRDVPALRSQNVILEDLVQFPDSNVDEIVQEIGTFWDRREMFNLLKLAYRRGVLMYGPPGTGKSAAIQQIARQVIGKGGYVLYGSNMYALERCITMLRKAYPETPLVVMMEDIDSILEYNNQSEVLNILDGVDTPDGCVFVATTNHPERLGERIKNRPSRFDRRLYIGPLSEEHRTVYVNHLFNKLPDSLRDDEQFDVERWVADTDGFTISHIQEVFTSIVAFGHKYEDAVERVSSLRDIKEMESKTVPSKSVGFI